MLKCDKNNNHISYFQHNPGYSTQGKTQVKEEKELRIGKVGTKLSSPRK